jgi:hypothetical protein
VVLDILVDVVEANDDPSTDDGRFVRAQVGMAVGLALLLMPPHLSERFESHVFRECERRASADRDESMTRRDFPGGKGALNLWEPTTLPAGPSRSRSNCVSDRSYR